MSPANIVVGRLYAKWCPHCIKIEKTYPAMVDSIEKNYPQAEFIDIEDVVKDKKLNEIYGNETIPKLEGFPTFFIYNKTTKDTQIYNGETDVDAVKKWIIENLPQKTGRRRRRRARRGTQRGGYKWSVRTSRKKTKRTAASKRAAAAAAAATSYTKK